MLDRQLTRWNDAFGLIADVEQDLVPIDFDDGAGNDVTVVEVLDGLVDRRQELLLGTDVIDRDLRGRWGGGRRGQFSLDAARHVEGDSGQELVVRGPRPGPLDRSPSSLTSDTPPLENRSPTRTSASLLGPSSRKPTTRSQDYPLATRPVNWNDMDRRGGSRRPHQWSSSATRWARATPSVQVPGTPSVRAPGTRSVPGTPSVRAPGTRSVPATPSARAPGTRSVPG